MHLPSSNFSLGSSNSSSSSSSSSSSGSSLSSDPSSSFLSDDSSSCSTKYISTGSIDLFAPPITQGNRKHLRRFRTSHHHHYPPSHRSPTPNAPPITRFLSPPPRTPLPVPSSKEESTHLCFLLLSRRSISLRRAPRQRRLQHIAYAIKETHLDHLSNGLAAQWARMFES